MVEMQYSWISRVMWLQKIILANRTPSSSRKPPDLKCHSLASSRSPALQCSCYQKIWYCKHLKIQAKATAKTSATGQHGCSDLFSLWIKLQSLHSVRTHFLSLPKGLQWMHLQIYIQCFLLEVFLMYFVFLPDVCLQVR